MTILDVDFEVLLIKQFGYEDVQTLEFNQEKSEWSSKYLNDVTLKMINFAYKAWANRTNIIEHQASFIKMNLDKPILFFENGEFRVRKLTGMREFNSEMVYTTNYVATELDRSLTIEECGKLKRINF